MEALHVGDGLVQPADGAGVAHRPLGPVPGGQVLAEDAADAHLARSEHLRALAVPAAHVGREGGEGLDVALPDIALPLREHLLIDVAVEAEDEALPILLGVVLFSFSSFAICSCPQCVMAVVPTLVVMIARCLALVLLLRGRLGCHFGQRRRGVDGGGGHHLGRRVVVRVGLVLVVVAVAEGGHVTSRGRTRNVVSGVAADLVRRRHDG